MPTERRLNSVRPFATIASLALAIAKYSYNNNKTRGQDIYERNADRMWRHGLSSSQFLVSTGRRGGGSIIERRRRSHLHGGTTKVAEVKLTPRAQRAKIIDNYRRASSRARTIYMYANPPRFTASSSRDCSLLSLRSSFRGNDSIPILVSATILPRNHPMIYGDGSHVRVCQPPN